jgi:hypothetical protein
MTIETFDVCRRYFAAGGGDSHGAEPLDPVRHGREFLDRVQRDATFQAAGVLGQCNRGSAWFVVDPVQHPLFVWGQHPPGLMAYAEAARALGAAVFSNGPMMGKRFGKRWKLGRRTALVECGFWPLIGAATGLALGRRWLIRLALSLPGAALGGVLAWQRVFTGWVPCGTIRGAHHEIDDRRDFDEEGRDHAWFGRTGVKFESYHIGTGNPPPDILEGAGGFIRLLRNGAPPAIDAAETGYDRDFAGLRHKRGVVAWGLAPLDHRGDGALVILGSDVDNASAAAVTLSRIGVRDAVATDQRSMIMLGSGSRILIGPPAPHRQTIQQYGLCCI